MIIFVISQKGSVKSNRYCYFCDNLAHMYVNSMYSKIHFFPFCESHLNDSNLNAGRRISIDEAEIIVAMES